MPHQVKIVTISQFGSDQAVFLDGRMVLSADPSCGDSLAPVSAAAESLASIHNCPVEHLSFEPEEDWGWDDVKAALSSTGELPGGLDTHVVNYDYIDDDGAISSAAASLHAEDYAHAAEQLVDELRNSGECLLRISGEPTDLPAPLLHEVDNIYRMNPLLCDVPLIIAGNLAVCLHTEYDALEIKVFPVLTPGRTPLTTTTIPYRDAVAK